MCKCGRVKGPEDGLSGSVEVLDGWRLWLDGGGLQEPHGNVTFFGLFFGLFFVLRTQL